VRGKRSASPWVLLALAALFGALWVRSLYVGDVLAFFPGGEGRLQVIASSDGRLCIFFSNIRFGAERSWTALHVAGDDPQLFADHLEQHHLRVWPTTPSWLPQSSTFPADGVLGFSVAASQAGVVGGMPNSQLSYATIPHWAAVALCGLAGPWMLLSPRARRARRREKGLCEQCGYDLRASRDRCPECGAAIQPVG